MLKRIIEHYRHNPEGYWFKRKLYGWGWVPVTWQGWLVTLAAVACISGGIYIGETDDAPGAALIGIVLGAALVFGFGRSKGEKVCWQWGLPDESEDKETDQGNDQTTIS